MKRGISILVLLVAGFATTVAADGLRLGRYYSDQMVLQRDKPNVIRGSATPGAQVTVSFSASTGSGQAGKEKTAKANEHGDWEVTLDPIAADGREMDLIIQSGREKLVLKNVVAGDVIFFARQSSIDISLGRNEEGKKLAASLKKHPGFRAIVIHTLPSEKPQADLAETATAGWRVVDEEQALKMSAAACLLGRDLAGAVDVPVGIVDVNLGWYFPVAWLSRGLLSTIGLADPVTRLEEQYEAFVAKTPYGGKEKNKKILTENPLEHPLYPSSGYNGILHPLRGIGLKGLIAQIGNDYPYMYYEKIKADGTITDRAALNDTFNKTYVIRKVGFNDEPEMLSQLPREWRTALGDAAMPFAFVAPPSSALGTYAAHNREMRELQRKLADKDQTIGFILPGMEAVPFSGQPRDEVLLAQRSLRWAQGTLYGKSVSTGPLFDRIEGEGTDVTIHFKEGTAKGLKAEKDALTHFEVADVDAEYVPASAVIDGETVRLSCDKLSRIFYVRYNWREMPDQGLVNADGLPAVPFRTENAKYEWLFKYKDDDLSEEYYTPANEWKSGAVTLINGQTEAVGYPHFSGWLGPVGIKTGPFGPNMGVREVAAGSPAYGKLFVGDVIYRANGRMLGEEEEMTMSAAITASEAADGKLVLGVHRDGRNLDIELKLEVMGRYSSTSPWNCLKTERIVRNLEEHLVRKGAPEGFLTTDAMFLLGAGSPKYQWLVRRTAVQYDVRDVNNNWAPGYSLQYLAEYYLSTGDRLVLPKIQKLVDALSKMQIREDNQRNGGWYGRGVGPRGYPAMSHAGISAMLGLALARECGVNVDPETFQRGLKYLERTGAPVGQIVYGDVYRSSPELIDPGRMLAGKLSTQNGKIAEAAVLYKVLGDTRSAYINSQISTHSWYKTYGGHGGHFWDIYWTPLGAAAHSKEAYIYFMKNHRWVRECDRMFDGSFITASRSVASSGLALVVPRQRLRILGAPKSPFSPDAPEVLKPALFAWDARDYAQAESLANALLDDIMLDKNDAPTVAKLAVEAKRMQDSIASDIAAIHALSKEGRLYEAGMMLTQLKPIVAESDPRIAAAEKAISEGTARANDKELYAASMKEGRAENDDESEAESADDLQRIQERKAAAAAAAAPERTWECLTPKVLTKASKSGKGSPDVRPVEEAAQWRYTILEHRDNAPEGWMKPEFDDSGWFQTTHPISWHVDHIALLRTRFNIKDRKAYDLLKFRSWVFRQQDVAIYLNGVLIGRINNIDGKTNTIENEFKEAALGALRDGENTLAIATRQNWRWGMMKVQVYNDGFDFMLYAREASIRH